MSNGTTKRHWLAAALIAIGLLPPVAALARVTADDPTRPLVPAGQPDLPAAAARRPTLESVLIGEHRRVAVIDGQRLAEGESSAGLKVWRILPEGVEVSVNGSRMLLEMPRSGVRKSPRRGPAVAGTDTRPDGLTERAGRPAPDHEDLM